MAGTAHWSARCDCWSSDGHRVWNSTSRSERRSCACLPLLRGEAADAGRGRGPDLMTTGVAARLIALGGLPQGGEIATVEFLHSCEEPGLGLRLAPTTAMTSVSALRGGLSIALALNAPVRYPQAVGRSIARLQHPNGGLSARGWAIPTLHDTWLALEAAWLLKRLQNEPQ